MKNPYDILGVSPADTDKEIKSAYRALAKKYHPDANPGSSYAAEKMREINEAYDKICEMRSAGSSSYGGYESSSYGDTGSYDEMISRALIAAQSGDIFSALNFLSAIPEGYRNARWHYASGYVYLRMNNYTRASREFAIAYNLEPTNEEYRAAYERTNSRSTGYDTYSQGRGFEGYNMGCSCCDLCSAFICLNSLCNCCFR